MYNFALQRFEIAVNLPVMELSHMRVGFQFCLQMSTIWEFHGPSARYEKNSTLEGIILVRLSATLGGLYGGTVHTSTCHTQVRHLWWHFLE